MNIFKKIYLWSFDAKLYMGIYFVLFTFYISIINYFTMGKTSIDIVILLQSLLICIFIAFSQAMFLNNYFDKNKNIVLFKYFIWIVISSILTLIVSINGNWFDNTFAYIGLAVSVCISLNLVLLGLIFEAEYSSNKLNDGLKRYKKLK